MKFEEIQDVESALKSHARLLWMSDRVDEMR